MKNFSRTFYKKENILPYKITNSNIENNEELKKELANKIHRNINNCHWGQAKLFFSELEFLLLCNKHVNIDECLVLYIGAADGYRVKHLFIKTFFPNINMLLYDPQPFHIENSSNIIVKTGKAGFFVDDTVEEVLQIANGRKILYITDIRIGDDDVFVREKIIYENIMDQQRWGIMMGADFMLLKFRMFFYQKDYKEIDFIDNTYINDPKIKDKINYNKNDSKHDDKTIWMLHLKGTIYSQILAANASTETRLYVKKIKYYKNADEYSKDDQNKYEMKYYNNLTYENVLNYYNIKIRTNPYDYKKSKIYCKYMPNYTNTYENVTEYYLFYKYLIYNKQKPTIKNILKLAYITYTFLNSNYKNNLISCIPNKKLSKYINKKISFCYFLTERKELIQKQFDRIKLIKSIDGDIINKFINSYNMEKNKLHNLFEIKNGIIKSFCNKPVTQNEYIQHTIDVYKEEIKD